jgi:hypothetical protein
MYKSLIKKKLRETLFNKIKEASKNDVSSDEKDEEEDETSQFQELSRTQKQKVNSLTKKIKNATQGSGKLLKLSQVMDAAGTGDADDASDRSAIGKAVSGKPDADGKIRHLTVKQANSMGKVVDNPTAFK